ncbi:radical SAM protein [Chloroflexota bacterium]
MKRPMKRILLINPFLIDTDSYEYEVVTTGGQFAETPLGLGYISAYAQEHINDLEIEILDANLMAMKHIISSRSCNMADLWDLLQKKIEEFSPDIVGISCLFHSLRQIAHQTCSLVKNISPGTINVMGGSYPTISYTEALKDPNLDYTIIGEGEVCFADLVLALNGTKKFEDLHGIAYRDTDEVIFRPNQFVIKDLDVLPFPDLRNISPDDYILPNDFSEYGNLTRNFLFRVLDRNSTKIAVIAASRGCPYSCTFCSAKNIWGKSIRYRSANNIVDEMELLVKKYGVNTIVLNDDNFTVNNEKASAIMDEMIKRKLNIRWGAGGGLCVSSLSEVMIRKMYESGIAVFNLAFESGSQITLDKILKKLDIANGHKVMEYIRKHGNGYVIGFFISGFHFETKEDIEKTLEFAGSLDVDWALIRNYQAIAGSEIYDECLERGLLPDTGIKYGHPLVTSSVNWPNFSEEYILRTNYLANLKINFLYSRNLNQERVEQAIADFNWIIELVPDHAIAYFTLGMAYKIKGDMARAKLSWGKAADILKTNKEFQEYFRYFNIDVDKYLNEIDGD